MFRTHLFGVPSIIVYTPAVNKFVLFSDDNFKQEWSTVELLGRTSMMAVHGIAHMRVRNFVLNAINRPKSLSRIATFVQARIVTTLQSWAQMGKIKVKLKSKRYLIVDILPLFIFYFFGVKPLIFRRKGLW